MPGTQITTSPNITLFDSKIVADTCEGEFVIDATPSTFITDPTASPAFNGALNVQGVKVKVTNPYGVVIKDYTDDFDIDPPLTGNYTQNIPTQAGKLQYGIYTIQLQLTDEDGTIYTVTKTVNVCTYNEATNPCDDRVRMIADCKNGRVTISITEPPYFKGYPAESKTQSWTLYYPTASGATPLTTTYGNYQVQLFQGEYKLVGSVCATYNMTDNVYLRLGYSGTFYKNVKCLLDYTCIWPRIKQLNDRIKEDCSQKERDNNASIILDALRLLKTAELANDAGEDASVYIEELEELLGCTCTCECSGLPITNNAPSSSVSITGCNVEKTTVGLTDIYVIENYAYIVSVNPGQGVISVGSPTLANCTKTQVITYSAAAAYAAQKTLISDVTEYNYWASVVNNALTDLDAACLGYTVEQWNALTLKQKFAALIAKACAGGSCLAVIENVQIEESGNANPESVSNVYGNVIISWDVVENVFAVEVYVDGVLKGVVLSSVTELEVIGVADGQEHDYVLRPICGNGSGGTTMTGTFMKLGCPEITPPVLSSNNVNGVECPYDLTGLESTPPVGIEIEWHTANNTGAASLVPDPTAVSSGVYYAFAKNADGCYSTSNSVTLICDGETSCTAPQTLTVESFGIGANHIKFQSAAFPPPGDSYTVKRKLAADPDIDGSYTTIGTPVWVPIMSRWFINDATISQFVLYTYKVISNCGDSPATTPSISYNHANIKCPTVTLIQDVDHVDYSFPSLGGGIDKYEISIYDESGTVLIQTDTHVPAFSNPITGTFLYLDSFTTYRVVLKIFIGSYSVTCDPQSILTLAP